MSNEALHPLRFLPIPAFTSSIILFAPTFTPVDSAFWRLLGSESKENSRPILIPKDCVVVLLRYKEKKLLVLCVTEASHVLSRYLHPKHHGAVTLVRWMDT